MMAENAVTQILKTLPSAAGATFLALFPIVNPFGGIPLFFSLNLGLPSKRAQPHCREDCHVCVWHPVVFMFFDDASCSFFWNLAAGAENCGRADRWPTRPGHGHSFNPNGLPPRATKPPQRVNIS